MFPTPRRAGGRPPSTPSGVCRCRRVGSSCSATSPRRLTPARSACRSTRPTSSECSGPNNPYIATHNAAERQAAASTGAHYIDTVPWFCSSVCTDVIGHYRPYWDGYHVTASYSMALGQVLENALDLPAYASTSTAKAAASEDTSPRRSKE